MINIIKKNFKVLLSLLLSIFMVMGFSMQAYAEDSTVTFENGKLIAFKPGSVYTDSDLFDNFKGMMPGDTRAEEVTVKNNSDDFDYIKVYMKAVLHDENGNPISEKVLDELKADERRGDRTELEYMYDFLSQLSMTVKCGDSKIYEASPDELDGLTENVYLATLRKGEETKLDVELTDPIEMGNDYMNRIGEVDWKFVVEGFDDPTPPPEEKTMLTVRKVWDDDGKDRPESIKVNLLQDGKVSESVTLSEDNQWTYTWDELSKKSDWSAVEAEVPEGYEASYKTEGNITTITNKKNAPTPPPAEPVDLTVKKVWDDNGKNRPDSVKVTLYNGETAVETVALGEWNDWTYTWRDLDGNGKWQVIEADIPKGYVPSYSKKDGVVTVKNTANLIQTGQLNWPIPVLSILGILLIAFGLYVSMKKRKNTRA